MFALMAGLLSFLSPCILPMVPIYLGMLGTNTKNRCATLQFCGGITLVFVLMGITATSLGTVINQHLSIFRTLSAVFVILLGLNALKWVKIPWFERAYGFGGKFDGAKPFLMGTTFAFSWSPCVGPILGAILSIAANAETVWFGGYLLFLYSVGLCIPLILAGIFVTEFSIVKEFLQQHLETVEFISGWFLILFGIAIAFNWTVI